MPPVLKTNPASYKRRARLTLPLLFFYPAKAKHRDNQTRLKRQLYLRESPSTCPENSFFLFLPPHS